jgi:Zn-dependent peptidase ImmA (M78 family)/DNA-binding XRE family transcriptional regulator
MIAERLIQARKAAGLSVQALSAKAGGVVTAQAISKYEKNKCKPTSTTLLALARALNVRTEFFFRPVNVDLGAIHFRKHSRVPAKTLGMIEGRTRDFVERYLTLEGVFPEGRFSAFSNPLKDRHARVPEDVEERAEELRHRWHLGLDPIPNMTELLEDRGVKVIFIDGEEGFDGLFTVVQGKYPVIVAGKGWAGERQRMTLAHELGHLVLLPEGSPREQEAVVKRFAGAFLIPAATARAELGERRTSLDWGELFTLKRKYGASVKAWLMRARDLEIIEPTRFVSLLKFYNMRGWNRGEPNALPQEEPTRFRRLLYQGLAEGFLTEGKAAELDGHPLRMFLQTMATEGVALANHSGR